MTKPPKAGKKRPEIDLVSMDALVVSADLAQSVIMHIDLLLKEADNHLGGLQPPIGRIRIEWWECPQSWAKQSVCPTLVRWLLSDSGAWRAERLPLKHLTQRARRNGWFRDSHAQVVDTLEIVSRLMTLRNRFTANISLYMRTMEALRKANEPVLLRTEDELAEIGEWVKLNAGALPWVVRYPEKSPAKQITPKQAPLESPLPVAHPAMQEPTSG